MVYLFCLAALIFGPSPAQANIGDSYSFGSRSSSLAGATVASTPSAYSSYINPAQLGRMGEHRLLFDYGLIWMTHRFTLIENVVIENDWASDKSPPTYGDVNTEYKDTLGHSIGVAFQLAPETLQIGFGVTLFLPLYHTAYMDSGETFAPEYVLYRSRPQQPQIEFGTGIPLSDSFALGLGLHTGFEVESEAHVFLQTSSNRPSYIRQAATAKPVFSPTLGLTYTPENRWSLGAVLRLAINARHQTHIDSGTGVFTGYPALDANFDATGAASYDPLSFEIGTQYEYLPNQRIFIQFDYQAWSHFETPMLRINNPSGVAVSTGNIPIYKTQDIIIPRFGHEMTLNDWKLRAGYAYKPSIFTELPSGPGNYLDPPKHMLNLGAGFHFDKFLGLSAPHDLDFHLTYHSLETQSIVKTSGNEIGTASDSKIGAPGYQAGGKILGGGVSLSFTL